MKKIIINYRLAYFGLLLAFLTQSCAKDKNGDRLLFSIDQDIALGEQVAHTVDSTYRAKGQLIERNNSRYAPAYQHLDAIVNRVLSSGQVAYKDEFKWDTKIIKDDKTLNAFATPGGHIYVFSGLIKYLDNEDQFAGVLGHEIAHADKRHTTKQLQTQYGINLLLAIVVGENQGALTQIATGLTGLKFGRDAEREADDFSVVYLSGTNYACNGAAGFFQKTQSENQSAGVPEFLSTHPDPGNRIEAINNKAQQQGCKTTPSGSTSFTQMKNILNQ
ncbi:M48 family metalloprotease [Adhaeribacter rhizoryzae]|uniref:M48 family metalloprotease n=1 Tax=Adhaeribacter rhizoryzae TaxID=2607907 RepID=A0A5M6DQF2_9BACT|nr:M48 family metalloprotease [Adhaeribacter rhizoryzae]KAA5547705.1 M48 family metalloprotease [Adhaeribacter rhizoryzae]